MKNILDEDPNGIADMWEEFKEVTRFFIKGDKSTVLKFIFKLCDIDNNGQVSNEELFQLLNMKGESMIKETQLQKIADKVIQRIDKDDDGKINFEEFQELFSITDIHKKTKVEFVDMQNGQFNSMCVSLSLIKRLLPYTA